MSAVEPPRGPTAEADAAALRVHVLLARAIDLLGLDPSDCPPAAPSEVSALKLDQDVMELPPSVEALFSGLGHGGPRTLSAALFGRDDVTVDALTAGRDRTSAKAQLLSWHPEVERLAGAPVVVIRRRGDRELDVVALGGPDPIVWAVRPDAPLRQRAETVTGWLAWRVHRSVKRRWPLREVELGAGIPFGAASPSG